VRGALFARRFRCSWRGWQLFDSRRRAVLFGI
jgi:hypothetical protein